jgi:hypothetical protein
MKRDVGNKFQRARDFADRALARFDPFPEELSERGACDTYRSSVGEIEELYEGLHSERDPDEIKAYRRDIVSAIRRARRSRPQCVALLKRYATRLNTHADQLLDVPADLTPDD